MAKFILSSDSCCDIPMQERNEKNIKCIPLTYIMDNKGEITTARDTYESEQTIIDFYKSVENGMSSKTSQLTKDEQYEYFKDLIQADKMDVVHITLSSGLSGTYDQAVMAAEKINSESEYKVYVVDSLGATIGQGLLTLEGLKMRDNNMTAKEASENLSEVRNRVHHWIIVNDLFHLKKGGRVSGFKAVIGSMLNLKPFIIINREGKLVPIAKNKGMKKSFAHALESILKNTEGMEEENIEAFIVHTNAYGTADEFEKYIRENSRITKIRKILMGTIIGTHIGPGGVAVAHIGTALKADVE